MKFAKLPKYRTLSRPLKAYHTCNQTDVQQARTAATHDRKDVTHLRELCAPSRNVFAARVSTSSSADSLRADFALSRQIRVEEMSCCCCCCCCWNDAFVGYELALTYIDDLLHARAHEEAYMSAQWMEEDVEIQVFVSCLGGLLNFSEWPAKRGLKARCC